MNRSRSQEHDWLLPACRALTGLLLLLALVFGAGCDEGERGPRLGSLDEEWSWLAIDTLLREYSVSCPNKEELFFGVSFGTKREPPTEPPPSLQARWREDLGWSYVTWREGSASLWVTIESIASDRASLTIDHDLVWFTNAVVDRAKSGHVRVSAITSPHNLCPF